jgi:[ribosomal protein S18]-alanine N-acetyltransferase
VYGSSAARSRTWVASVSRPTGVATRPAQPGDLQPLSEIEEQAFARGYSPVIIRQLLELFPGLFFVGTYEEEVCGYVVGGYRLGAEEAWLLSLAVAPEARGKGVSTALLDSLIAALEGSPARWLKLTVDPSHEDALGFYWRRGFEQIAIDDEYFGPGKPRLILGRRL